MQFLIVPTTRCTWVRESDPRREQLPMRRKRRRKKNTTSIQSSSRYFQSQRPLSVNTGGLRPITSAERHQPRGERQERVPVRGGSQWEALFKSGSGGRRREQVGSLTNLLNPLQRAPGSLAVFLGLSLFYIKSVKCHMTNTDVKTHLWFFFKK